MPGAVVDTMDVPANRSGPGSTQPNGLGVGRPTRALIDDMDRGARYDSAGRIGDHALNGAGTALGERMRAAHRPRQGLRRLRVSPSAALPEESGSKN